VNELVRKLLYLPEQASSVALAVDSLHYAVIGVTMAGSTVVFVAALWFTIRYRRRPGQGLTPLVRAPLWLECLVIVGLFGLFLLFWVIGFRQYVRLQTPPDGAAVVYVTAKQWMWKFAHPGGRNEIGTLVVPAGRPVKLVMTSRDVIHSFYVPAFRVKQDVVPGRYTTVWFEATAPGRYPIYCAEYCGVGHSKMWGDVVALSPEDYEAWEEGAEPEGPVSAPGIHESLAARGVEVAARRGCLACHTLDGQVHVGPSWKGAWNTPRRLADGTTVVADEAYLTRSMMEPAAQLVAGYPAVMPPYQGLLEPAEVGALLELIRSLRPDQPEAPGVAVPPLPPGSETR
jgi:cytochrome c oxidase subunit 2